ncbi:MAG TPA: RagB/SusD family nutrient uptake outer membrane protein [Hanamia sp.]
MKIKNSIIFSLLFILTATSCKKQIDIQPKGAINPANLGQNEVRQLLTGVYRSFQNNPSGYSFVLGDLMGENLTNSSLFNSGDIVDFVQGTVKTSNNIVYQMWWGYYNGVFNCNTLLQTLDKLQPTATNKQIAATAKYFRAYGYFNLAIRWGGVPLLTQPTTGFVKRSSLAETWALIKNDLQAAIPDLPPIATIASDPQYNVSQEAAQALMARVALYTGDNATAATLAEGLINNPKFALENDFSKVYHTIANKELIFGFKNLSNETGLVANTNNSFTNSGIYTLFTTNAFPQRGSYVYLPTQEFQNLFTSTDTRTTTSFVNYNNNGLVMVNKFWNYEPIIISRIAEMYLISAEAQGLAGINRLNQLRQVRGLPPVVASNTIDYMNAIQLERRKELFGEGHRLYDLIRTNTAIGTLQFITDKNKLLLPIPQQEIDVNNNPTDFPQNPGY